MLVCALLSVCCVNLPFQIAGQAAKIAQRHQQQHERTDVRKAAAAAASAMRDSAVALARTKGVSLPSSTTNGTTPDNTSKRTPKSTPKKRHTRPEGVGPDGQALRPISHHLPLGSAVRQATHRAKGKHKAAQAAAAQPAPAQAAAPAQAQDAAAPAAIQAQAQPAPAQDAAPAQAQAQPAPAPVTEAFYKLMWRALTAALSRVLASEQQALRLGFADAIAPFEALRAVMPVFRRLIRADMSRVRAATGDGGGLVRSLIAWLLSPSLSPVVTGAPGEGTS